MAVNPQMDDLTHHNLTAASFPDAYRRLVGMRFPLPVAEVLEWRDVLNQAIDGFREAPVTPDYRIFLETLEAKIERHGVDRKRHSDRLLKILTLFRELHYAHSVQSRDEEQRIRQWRAENRRARLQSMKYGAIALIATLLSTMAWIGIDDAAWWLKLVTVFLAYLAWDYFHILPTLDREMDRLTADLNRALRTRIKSLDWETLIHRLSLILGYRQTTGVEVFRIDTETEPQDHPPLH